MSRYIVVDLLLLRIDMHGTNKFGMLDEDIREFIRSIPTADVAEVKHGRWVVFDFTPYCSVCRRQCDYNGDGTHSKSLFCPNCGAKMDEGGKS